MSTSRVKNVIFCDEIRHENNGKMIAFGIYPHGVGIPSFPVEFKICLLLTIDVHNITESFEHVNFDLLMEGDEKAEIEFRFEIKLTKGKPVESMLFPSPQIGVKIQKPGNLLFREKDSEGNVLQTFKLPIDPQKQQEPPSP